MTANAMPSELANACDGMQALTRMMQTPPLLTLKIYPFGALMGRKTEHGFTEYLVDPAQIATQLAAHIRLDTGVLSGNTIYMAQEGGQKIVVEYRPRRKTAIFLEEVENPLVIPLPELLLFRRANAGGQPEYRVFAVKGRPEALGAPLFHAPLPNTYSDGRICWGTVQQLHAQTLQATRLDEDFKLLLGTPFGNHSVSGKSRAHGEDIRRKYVEMEAKKTRTYPKSDLIPTRRTVQQMIEELLK